MLKKILTIGIFLVILSTVIIGCGSDSTKTNVPENEDVVTLKYITIGKTPNDKELVVDNINEYLEEKINVNIDLEFIDYGDYNQKTSIMLNSGEQFDLMFTCSWAGDYIGNSRKGAFLDLTPYLDNIGKDMYQEIDSRFWRGSEIDKKIFAVPNQKELASMEVWRFTKEYVDKYDIPYKELKTFRDLEPWLKIIKENEPDVIPYYISKGAYPILDYRMDTILLGLGVEANDESFTVKNSAESEGMKEEIELIKKYYDAGYINTDAILTENNEAVKRFCTKANGQPYADEIWTRQLGYEVVSTQVNDSIVTNDSAIGSMIAISSNSKNPEKAVEFLNLLNTDSYLRNLINYGIEGTHYTKVEGKNNTIKLDPIKSKDYEVGYYTLGNLFITYVFDTEPETKWEEFQEFNDKAINSPLIGFRFDTNPVVNEISAISNVISEFERVLYSGTVNTEEYLKKYNEKLYGQGLQKVIDEMQRQLDEWLKTK